MEKILNMVETPTKEEEVSSYDLKIEPRVAGLTKTQEEGEQISVACFVLLVDSKQMCAKDYSFNLDLLGVPMFEYVARSCPKPPACLRYEEGTSIIQLIRPYVKDAEYSLVLFSDTPLMTRANVMNILAFAKNKGLNVCKLTRGYVFKNEYIKRVDEIYAPSTYYFEEEDFMVASSNKQLYIISQILKNRVLTYHMNNGVHFLDPDTTYIESNVAIGKGTTIYPFVSLMKDTVIQENCVIKQRTTLINAKVYEGAKLEGCYVDGGIIQRGATIKNGVKIYAPAAIKENASVAEDSILSNVIIGASSMVGKNCILEYVNCHNNCSIGNNCHICASKENAALLKDETVIENGVTLGGGTYGPKQKIDGQGK